MDTDTTFEQDLETRKKIAEIGGGDALALLSALVERDMDHNFNLMSSLYESERVRNEELRAEIEELRLDAMRWRQFCYAIKDTIDPEVWT